MITGAHVAPSTGRARWSLPLSAARAARKTKQRIWLCQCAAQGAGPSELRSSGRGPVEIIQLKRALTSAILNLAEGNGRRSWKERNRFFDISIASIDEVDAACDLLVAFALVPCLVIEAIQRDLRASAAMIMQLRRL